jgi:citrate synthase
MSTLLSAEEAAQRLGVSKATLYAYVSRGRLHRTIAGDGRRSLFDAAEIAQLRKRAARPVRPGSIDLRLDSAVTRLDESSLSYRGVPIKKLVGSKTFEETAELLWGAEHAPWRSERATTQRAAGCFADEPDPALRGPGTTASQLASGVLLASRDDDYRQDLRPESVIGSARRMITAVTTALPGVRQTDRSVANRIWRHLARRMPRDGEIGLVDAALVALADHELATSTFAVRLAASTRTDPYAAVAAGLSVVSGSLHGSASAHVVDLFEDAHQSGRPARAIADRLASGSWVPGFGHQVYRDADPRCVLLLDLLDRADVDRRRRSTVHAVLEEADGRVTALPNVDLALAAVSFCCALPASSGELIFSVARMAGWIAHYLEELDEAPLRYRVRAVYRGV